MATFSDYLARGTGAVEYRVVIEGCPASFVTSEVMQGTESSDVLVEGRRRVAGLLRRGLTVSESVYIPGAELRVTLGSVSIEDTGRGSAWYLRGASEVFSAVAEPVSYLRASVSSAATLWSVQRAESFTVGVVYHCDTEAVLVLARDTTANAITVRRGMWGTVPQGHFVERAEITGSTTLVCPVYSAPRTYRNRRVWVYGHGDSELDTTATGTLIARAIVSGTPRLDGAMTWQFSLEPRTRLLEQSIGPAQDSASLAGIYYPSTAPFVLQLLRQSGAEVSGAPTDEVWVRISGWWASQADWCAAIASALNAHATISTWGATFSAGEFGAGWRLRVTMPAASPRYIRVAGGSPVDGYDFTALLQYEAGANASIVGASTTYVCLGARTLEGWVAAPGTGLRALPADVLGTVPRSANVTASTMGADTTTSYPRSRFYVAGVSGVSIGTAITLTVPTGDASITIDGEVSAVDTTAGYVELDEATMRGAGTDDGIFGAQCTAATEVAFVKNYGTGNLAGLLLAVASDAAANANAGVVPFVTTDDFDFSLTGIGPAVSAAALGRPWLTQRVYRFGARVKLADVIKHEARLYSLFMGLSASGAITFRPVATRPPADFTFGAAHLLVGDDAELDIGVDLEPEGIVTGVQFKTGYDVIEDKHTGGTTDVVAVGAVAAQREYTPIEVAPKSRAFGTEPTPGDLYVQGNVVVQHYSAQRFVVQLDAPVTWTQRLTGDAGRVTIAQIPFAGQRAVDGGGGGLVLRRGVIIGKEWALDEPAVRLTMQFDSLEANGYAPQGRVVSQTGSSTTWSVTLDAAMFSSASDASFFASGMKVRLVEYDVATPTERTGTVASVVGNIVALTLDSAWVPGASTWDLMFRETDTAGLLAAQLDFVSVALATGVIALAGGVYAPADNFAP